MGLPVPTPYNLPTARITREGTSMSNELRRFPRVACTEQGELELHKRHLDPTSDKIRLPVELFSMSCDGIGLSLRRPAPQQSTLIPGSQVTITFAVGGEEIQLPARVVWSAGTRAGLRLRLARADEHTRQTFARWIVPLTNKAAKQRDN